MFPKELLPRFQMTNRITSSHWFSLPCNLFQAPTAPLIPCCVAIPGIYSNTLQTCNLKPVSEIKTKAFSILPFQWYFFQPLCSVDFCTKLCILHVAAKHLHMYYCSLKGMFWIKLDNKGHSYDLNHLTPSVLPVSTPDLQFTSMLQQNLPWSNTEITAHGRSSSFLYQC